MSSSTAQPPLDVHATPVPAPEVTSFQLDDDLVLYDARTTQAHVLNRSAARIWELCDGSRTLSLVIEDVSTAYALDRAQAQADVGELVASLQAAGLLTMI